MVIFHSYVNLPEGKHVETSDPLATALHRTGTQGTP